MNITKLRKENNYRSEDASGGCWSIVVAYYWTSKDIRKIARDRKGTNRRARLRRDRCMNVNLANISNVLLICQPYHSNYLSRYLKIPLK